MANEFDLSIFKDARPTANQYERQLRRLIDQGKSVDPIEQAARVLSSNGQATLVVGNSCLKGVFIRNAGAVAQAAQMSGLRLVNESERALPARNRYLPTPDNGALGKRMRTETILTFAHA